VPIIGGADADLHHLEDDTRSPGCTRLRPRPDLPPPPRRSLRRGVAPQVEFESKV